MPVTLSLYSEPYGSTGNIGENFLRLLGAPSTDPLQTVIREAVQNIADAAKFGQGPSILIRLRRLNPDQRAAMRDHVLHALPDEPSSQQRFKDFLSRDEQIVLEICDFGTTGLGGPTRADRIPLESQRNDFINFLRNVGAPRDTDHGGGTYGFGKASLYAVSRCRTILVDTLVAEEDGGERRLIGCHVGSQHEFPEDGYRKQFTGRHWWGVSDPVDSITDPAVGSDASELAEVLGFPRRDVEQSGTSIMMLDFDPNGEELLTIGHRIVEGLLYSFWPRMMRGAAVDKKFSCLVEVDGMELEIADPETFPPLDLFCRAMRKARARDGDGVERIFSKKPAKTLGWLSIEKGLRSERRFVGAAEDSMFPRTSRHIALMRPVQLVVKYLEGTALPDERLEWSGVFLASDEDEVERAFALSEPPAHDDWIPGNLEKGYAKTFVNVALRKLDVRAAEFGLPAASGRNHEGEAPPLAKVSGMLGAALEGVHGEGAGRPRPKNGGGGLSRPLRARASRPVFLRLEQREGTKVAVFTTSVQQDADCSGKNLHASAAVAIDGAAVLQLDQAIVIPEVIEIRAEDGSSAELGNTLTIDGASGSYEIVVRMPDECAVTVDAEIQSGDGI
jgi:hypothetical protein